MTIPVTQVRTEAPSEAPLGNYQDMWWAGPAENGWGVSIVQRGEKLFAVVYGYDASANPMWLVLPSGGWNPARTTFSGALYAPRGTPFDAYDASRLIVGSSVGPAYLTFFDADHGALDISVNGVHVRKNIVRNRFGPVAATSGPSYGDMWWGGTSQNGWGVALLQQYRTIFGVWYTYGADGFTTWFVMPSGTWTSANTYEGKLYRTRGPTWLGADYDPAKLQVIEVGTFRLTFTGEAATMAYSVDGKAGTLGLSRLQF